MLATLTSGTTPTALSSDNRTAYFFCFVFIVFMVKLLLFWYIYASIAIYQEIKTQKVNNFIKEYKYVRKSS